MAELGAVLGQHNLYMMGLIAELEGRGIRVTLVRTLVRGHRALIERARRRVYCFLHLEIWTLNVASRVGREFLCRIEMLVRAL